MKLTKTLEAEIKKVYLSYWESYFSGNLKKFATTIDTDYKLIGTSESEIVNSKSESAEWLKASVKEIKGKAEFRKRKISVSLIDELAMVNEFSDAYLMLNKEWKFYSKIRISTFLRLTKNGWKIVQQHGSLPDARTEVGETVSFETLSKENLQLKEAVQRRTAELEEKNRELEIETSLERVRAVAMSMEKPEELLQICKVLFHELHRLGFTEIRNALINTFEDNQTYLLDYDYSDFLGGTISKIPIHANLKIWNHVKRIKKIKEAFSETIISKTELKKWITDRRKRGEPEDARLQKLKMLCYYFYSIGSAAIGISTVEKISAEKLSVLKRFRNVFNLSYQRYIDISNAEAQAREAKIEAALEKVRSRGMGMQKSNELQEVIRIVYEQLVQLKIHVEHAGFLIDYKTREDLHIWLADEHLAPSEVIFPWFDCPPNNAIREARDKGDDYFFYHLNFKEKNKFYRDLFKLIPNIPEETIQYYLNCAGLAGSGVLLENIGLYIENFSGTPYSDEENTVLMRFGKVFQQTYTRFLDLHKAEAQARQAQIEASLERMRSVAMSIRKTEELIKVAESMYKELKALGISNIRNAQIVIKIEGDERYLVCVYADDTSEVFTESRYETSPATQQMYDELETSNDALYQRELTGKDFEQWMKWRKSAGAKIEKKLVQAKSVTFCLYSIGEGHLGISAYNSITEEQLLVVKRFKNVFELSYRKFMDVAKSEEQALKLKQEKERLENTLHELQATQKQLIQSEKMASLGELTAGIAHEIQNPLNFVNNFSEVSNELLDEMNEELDKGELDEAKVIAADVKLNLEKINYHGKRADAIVKGMLQHSRGSSGQKELTDLNVLCDEYLRLSYHGLRAKDKSFNAKFETDFDASFGKINIVPQDIGRVILNLINNAFYAVNEKNKQNMSRYEPTVSVATKKEGDKVLISVKDNGNGIPEKIKDKIFQPFFTTKPTGSGTGLGLSLSYDIVKAHGGEIKLESKEGDGTEFIIQFPAV